MRLGNTVCVVFCSLLLAACASLKPKLQELPVPPQRIAQKGYSLVPPNEKGWVIVGRNQYQLALGKFGENQDETIAIQAMPVRLQDFNSTEEFMRLIREGQAKDLDPKRFAIKKSDVVVYPTKGSNCVKGYHVAEDNSAVKRSGKSGNMILELVTLTCAHPKDKSIGVNISYSHRHYPEQEDVRFVEKAMNVLDSVELTEF